MNTVFIFKVNWFIDISGYDAEKFEISIGKDWFSANVILDFKKNQIGFIWFIGKFNFVGTQSIREGIP